MEIRLELLGGLRVLAGGLDLANLQQHRILAALLAYVAVEGRVRRDAVVATFWPESDSDHARRALRQTLYRLRKTLGEDGWLEVRGDELIAGASLSCDVCDFDAAVARNDHETAARLYSGSFLNAVHLADVQPWEAWVDAHRARLARAHRQNCRAWVEARLRADDVRGALAAAHAWVSPDPLEDEAQHRLIELLVRVGDRTGALQQYESYERLLQAEGLAPLEHTAALYRSLQGTMPAVPVPATPALPRAVEKPQSADRVSIAALAAQGDPRAFERSATFLSRLQLVGPRRLLAGLGLLVLATVLWLVVRPDAQAASISPLRIAVFPFHVSAGAERSDWSEALMELVSGTIDGVGEIRRVDPFAIMSRLDREGIAGTPDIDQARRISRELGAGRFVLGSALELDGKLRVSASLYSSERTSEPVHIGTFEQPPQNLPTMVTDVARGLLAHVPAGEGEWLQTAARLPTKSYEALRAFAAGEALLRRARYDSAIAAFETAISEDSAFALAWLRLSLAGNFAGRANVMARAADHAIRYPERLSRRDRMLAAVTHAASHGDGSTAERHALELVSEFPESVSGWAKLGAMQFWHAWQQGESPLRADTALERARALDANHPQVVHLLGWIAYLRGDRLRADSLVVEAWGGPGPFLMLPREERDRPRFWNDLSKAAPPRVTAAALNTAMFSDSLVTALRIAALLVDPERRSANTRAFGHLLQGLIEMARGRWHAGAEALATANVLQPGTALLERGFLAALPISPLDQLKLRVLRDSIASSRSPIPQSDSSLGMLAGSLSLPAWPARHSRHYVLGLLSARISEAPEALRYAALLEAAAEPIDSIGLLRDLALEIRALLAMNTGGPQAGLAILDSLELRVASHYEQLRSVVHMRPLARFLRAEVLYELQRYEDALGWLSGLCWSSSNVEIVLLAPVNVRIGEIHERMGKASLAAEHYARFVSRWRDADAELLPEVRAVEERLRRLQRRRD
jgi:DNA-binding SARP family transcriptional activator